MAPRFVTLGWSAISWIEHYLVHGPGDVQGQPIELDDEFAEFILKAYRLDPATGSRLVRRAFLSRSKGRSKSCLAAFVACFEALGPARFDHWAAAGEVSAWGYEYEQGEPVGSPLVYVEALCVATEEGQAGNTYDGIHYMLDPETCSDALAEDYGRLDVGLTRINLPDSRGFIEPVSSGDTSKDGGKSTFIVADETHLWLLPRLKRLHAVMTRNLLKRKVASGWMLETSTMYGTGEDSVAEGTHLYAMTAKPGTRAAESLLFDHRQASESWDVSDPAQRLKALREAYGPAAEWMDLEALADAWDDPQTNKAEYRRYWLNQPVPMVAEQVSIMPKWSERGIPDRHLDGKPALALAVSYDRMWASVGAATKEDGLLLVKPLRHGGGTDWVVEQCRELQARFGSLIFLDKNGPAATFKKDLTEVGVRFHEFDSVAVCDAAALVFDTVEADTLRHFNHPELNRAAADATWRPVGGRKAFARKNVDVTPLDAVSLAALAVERGLIHPPPAPRRAKPTTPARDSVAAMSF
jgi:hypothetical protein